MTQYVHIVLTLLVLSCYLCRPALGHSSISSTKCLDKERKALLQFKDGITQDSCGMLDSWGKDSDCCKWRGVQCSNYTGHVTMLRLEGIDLDQPCLEGSLSNSLVELKYLRHLNLSFNIFIVGSLDWLLHLRFLRYLDLSGANLSEAMNWIQIVSKLPFLSVLRMDGCQLPVNIPTSLSYTNSSSNFRTISLSQNQINDSSLFQWLFNLPGISTQLVYLDLSLNALPGPIPIDFGKLQNLSHLDLSINELQGPIPNGIGNLQHLSYLDLSNNYLEGLIPSEFKSMASLSYLSLTENNLQGSVFKIFTRLCNLQKLYLGGNNFTDELTDVIQSLLSCDSTKLLSLELSRNHFWGAIPDTISSFSLLKELYLDGNQLNGKISQGIGHLVMLEKLDISSSSLEATLTQTHFIKLSRLRELYLSDNPRLVMNMDASWDPPFQLDIISLRNCKLGPYIPNWLQMQTNFSYFDISNSKISGTIPRPFWNSLSSNLRYLNMSYNKFYGLLPDLPGGIDLFSPEVDLSSNLLEGAIPSGLTNVFSLYLNDNRFTDSFDIFCPKTTSSLSEVDLSNNLLSGELPDCWMKIDQLESLHLENNKFSGSIPESLGALTNLQYLHLHNNSFSGQIPASFENCTDLAILNLGYNSFTGNIPPWLGNIQSLGAIILRRNNFLGEIPSSLCQLPNLQILDFAMNHISGVIPRCINNLTGMTGNTELGLFFVTHGTSLGRDDVTTADETAIVSWKREEQEFKNSLEYVKSIDFSFNELDGEIPDGIFNLTGLESLDLSRNKLSGSIASEIGQLAALEFLDLSHNHLTGKIPDSLAKLNYLGILGLSYNNLSGRIPLGTQLLSFNASSYVGNAGLCGEPLPKCPTDEAQLNGRTEDNSNSVQDEHEDNGLFTGFYISMVLGIIVGFWGVCGTLVIKTSWRYAWFRFLNDTQDRFYPNSAAINSWGNTSLGKLSNFNQ